MGWIIRDVVPVVGQSVYRLWCPEVPLFEDDTEFRVLFICEFRGPAVPEIQAVSIDTAIILGDVSIQSR